VLLPDPVLGKLRGWPRLLHRGQGGNDVGQQLARSSDNWPSRRRES
jgi:hypothetical protein